MFKDRTFTKIFYMGSASEFGSITIEEGNDGIGTSKVYYYSESTPLGEGDFFHFVNGEIAIY